jgi:beta-fructofuranosidase
VTDLVTAGPFTPIYDPGADRGAPWYINDHTLIRDDTGRWHLFGITHAEPADPDNEVEFAHATAPALAGPWTTEPHALRVDPDYGETHLWAPFVVRSDAGEYCMFYAGGGADHTAAQLNLATSADLFHWTRRPAGPLFTDGYDARDPMIRRLDAGWIMYYCATSTPAGGNHIVAYRTSPDLLTWSEPGVAYRDRSVGTLAGPTESPFVVAHGGWWYLFLGPRPDYVGTDVLRSADPRSFRIEDKVGHIAAHAAEVVSDAGQWWITSCGWGQGGVFIAPLRFHDDGPAADVPLT